MVAVESPRPRLQQADGALLVDREAHLELALALAAVDGEDAVGLERGQGLRVVPIHLVGRLRLLGFVAQALDLQLAAGDVEALDRGPPVRILREPLGQYVHRSLHRVPRGRNGQLGRPGIGRVDEARRGLVHGGFVGAFHDLGQGTESPLEGQHAPRLLLLLEGSPDILDLRERRRLAEVRVQRLVELAQGVYPANDLETALLEGLARLEFMGGVSHLDLVQAPGALLSVTADERDRATLADEGDDRRYLTRLYPELGGDLVHDGYLVDLEIGDGAFGQFHGGYGTGSRVKKQ